MKAFKTIGLFGILFSLAVFTWSCAGNTSGDQGQETTEASAHGDGPEYTSAYVCPMHCEGSGSDAEGTCPVCGMAYVPNEEHVSDGHSH